MMFIINMQIEKILKERPFPYLLTRIPDETSSPYKVRVRKQPHPHYEIKSIK